MIPRIHRNEHWQCELLPTFLKLYNLEQNKSAKYIHWCELLNDPDSHPAILGDITRHIPSQVLKDAADGLARIVFATYQESTNPTDAYPIEHCHDFDLTLEKFCEDNEIPYNNVVWISGDMRVQQRQKSKKIRTYPYTCYGHEILFHVHQNKDVWDIKPITERNMIREFVCLQRFMKPGRIFWTYLLQHNNLLDSNFVSVADRIHGWGFLEKAKTFLYLFKEHQGHISKKIYSEKQITDMWHTLADVGLKVPYVLDVQNANNNWCAGSDTTLSSLPYYNSSFMSVITETDIQSQSLFISEATFRPFVYQQPAVWVGQHGLVQQLRDWGFKTWDWLYSEDYDTEPFMIDRLEKCIESVKQARSIEKTPELLEKIHKQNLYNWNHLQHQFMKDQGIRFAQILASVIT